ncbi:response regulator transcription factor [Paenibacillus sp.]|uniref:response regulator transcription factor n=1 Tax=Paenibacillus sp. TaxID=58172 RepID=UPI002D3603C5|nr:response regulator [Paenibacillus sp.]HZG83685.1 response regulator [Paenibacillus sp.]
MYKLLLVDDEVEIRNGLSQYFPWSEIGFELVGQCENGKKALDFMAEKPVDVVLCDIMMPVLNGLEVAKSLYETKSPVKIIFLSGYKDFEYAKQALEYDVKGYIVKPTKYDELYAVFSKLKLELDEQRRTAEPEEADGAPYAQKVIAAVKAYAERHYQDATLEEAAARVHMNPFYLSKYFKEKTGQNFSDYIVSLRMTKAAELLMDIRYKTYEVSELVGYSHAKNFTRTFKKFHGVSPRDYRNRHIPSAEAHP